MASERKPELVIVDTLKDKHGRTVKVGYRGADVEIIVTPHSGHDGRIALDGEQRDRFLRAFAESADDADDARQAASFAASRAKGRDVVESAARALIGIPDNL